MIDLRQDIIQIDAFIKEGIAHFESTVSCPTWVGVYSCPHYGWICLCFETSKYLDESKLNCPDFEYVEHSLVDFETWTNTYEKAFDSLSELKNNDMTGGSHSYIKSHTGEAITLNNDFGDREFDLPFFEALVSATAKIKCESSDYKYFVQLLDSPWLKII